MKSWSAVVVVAHYVIPHFEETANRIFFFSLNRSSACVYLSFEKFQIPLLALVYVIVDETPINTYM